MRAVLHYLFIEPFAYLLAVLPFPIQRGLSKILYFIIYHLIGYRKNVVRDNLSRSFPDKSAEERKRIEKKFFLHLTDIMLETLKMLTISLKTASRHIIIPEDSQKHLDRYNQIGQTTIIAFGHYGCWEWTNIGYHTKFDVPVAGIYHPLSDPWFEKLMFRLRTRFGSIPVRMNETYRYMVNHSNETYNMAFIADQSPSARHAYWTIFLNQETGFYNGVEKMAKKLNLPVLFLSFDKIKRNYYQMNIELITDDPQSTQEGEITQTYIRKLEKRIQEKPEYWLWSHRRWKRSRPEGVRLHRPENHNQ
ncbi:MAG: lysophospholipid acyltransferase family protein [Bacteroidota bacterium]